MRKRIHSAELADVHNDWTVIAPDIQEPGVGWTVQCQCFCGAIKTVKVNGLVTGKTKSCGCLRIRNSEKAMEQLKNIWLNLPKGEMDWMSLAAFTKWALQKMFKTNSQLKKFNEELRLSVMNCYWDPERKSPGRKKVQQIEQD